MPRAAGSRTTGSIRRPLFARLYPRMSVAAETGAGIGELRAELLAGLSGRVVEVGAGNGLNFAHYPAGVTRVLAVEPEPRLRELATDAARRAPVPVEVVAGTADALPAEAGSFDAAVSSLVLCSVPDVPRALAEIRRVLRDGGELRFLEHGRASDPGMVRLQRVLDASRLWRAVAGGCRTARDPLGAIGAAGFTDVAARRLRVPANGPRTPTSPHVLGSART